MRINEYKNEVSSLRLSDDFKQELKQKMLEAAENSPAKPEIKKSGASVFTAKYSRYIALAACLLLVVSTVSIVSVGGLTKRMKLDKSEEIADDSNINLALYIEDDAPAEISEGFYDESDDEVYDRSVSEPVESQDPESENTVIGSDEEEESPAADSIPRSGNGYSSYASSEYEGDYNGEDYVLTMRNSASYTAQNVTSAISLNAELLVPIDTNPQTNSVTTEGVDTPTEGIEDKPAVEATGATTDNDEEPIGYDDVTSFSATFEELTSGDSYKYYDIRDGVIAKLDEVGLIRFTVKGAYTDYDEIMENVSVITMDIGQQTLYSINVTYDYFNSEEVSVEKLLLNDGNYRTQLIGRPVMDGEYIAVVYENDDGVLEPVPQLVYAVHRVNGLDIAYHVYSGDGFMVDPGNTNMGLMPEEYEVYTTTTNNPEIYTQKAAVRELTYYLRRNILRMEPKLLSFASSSSPEEIEYRSSIHANYPSGKLVVSSEGGRILVNGVGEGDDMQTALKALLLSELNFTPDATLTLAASEEDGGWKVIVYFNNGHISGIDASNGDYGVE